MKTSAADQSVVRVGIVGAGFMGGLHARAYRLIPMTIDPTIRVEVIRVADASQEAATQAALAWGVEEPSTRWQDVIDDARIDLVDLCTPPAYHTEAIDAAISAGKHVYCEKPVGTSVGGLSQLADQADEANVTASVGYNFRWCPAIQRLKQLLKSGFFGEVRHYVSSFRADWANDPDAPWEWRFDREIAGDGALGDVGSHVIDMATFLIGELSELAGETRTHIQDRPLPGSSERRRVTNDDSFVAMGRTELGADVQLSGSRVATGRKIDFRLALEGSHGAAEWSLNRLNELRIARGQEGFQTVLMGPDDPFHDAFAPAQGISLGFADTKVIEAYQCLGGVLGRETSIPDFRDAAKVWEAMMKISSG